MKGFIVNEKHLVVATRMKDVLLLAVKENIVEEEGFSILSATEDFMEIEFFRKVGDLNNLEEVKELLSYYKDETISLSYNGEYVLSQETVGRYMRSIENNQATLICSKATAFNLIIGKDTWMKVDQYNPISSTNVQVTEPIVMDEMNEESEEDLQMQRSYPWPYAVKNS